MPTPSRRTLLLSLPLLAVAGCTAPGEPRPSTPAPASAPPAAPAARRTPPPDTRTGKQLDQPYIVDGLPVVTKDHRLSEAYVPPWSTRQHGLHADVLAAFAALQAAAKADGLPLSIRSGYRSYATQKVSFERALKTYDEATARRYHAEPGASEHQLGLALDAWDGRNRGDAFKRTRQSGWLADHAHEHGFIVRYPESKEEITRYAWEPWHLRWVGTQVSRAFGPRSALTLEEYLGLV